ncbi:hypothetical protein [Salinarimonas rosea]|uniref:hypothetical protein n=1 Tax=Salinarimonas rosea TaxID=552063 RepID=UPI000401D8BF|nr:hypothetical protein [Salinarimonas rosea]
MTRPRNRLAVLPGPLPAAPFASREIRSSPGTRRLLRLGAAAVLACLTVLVLRAATPDAAASAAPSTALDRPAATRLVASPEACDPRPWRQRASVCSQALPDGAPRLVRIVSLAPATDSPRPVPSR